MYHANETLYTLNLITELANQQLILLTSEKLHVIQYLTNLWKMEKLVLKCNIPIDKFDNFITNFDHFFAISKFGDFHACTSIMHSYM